MMPKRISGLILIQSVRHSDGIPIIFFFEKVDLKKSADEKKNHEKLSRVQGVNHLLHRKSFDPFKI